MAGVGGVSRAVSPLRRLLRWRMGWGAVPQVLLLEKKNLFLHGADGGSACHSFYSFG